MTETEKGLNPKKIRDIDELQRSLKKLGVEGAALRELTEISSKKTKLLDYFSRVHPEMRADFVEACRRIALLENEKNREILDQVVGTFQKEFSGLKQDVVSGVGDNPGVDPKGAKSTILGSDYRGFTGEYGYRGEGAIDPTRVERKATYLEPERTKRNKVKFEESSMPLMRKVTAEKVQKMFPEVDSKIFENINIVGAFNIIVNSKEPIGESKDGWKNAGYSFSSFWNRTGEVKALARLEEMYRNNTNPKLSAYMKDMSNVLTSGEGKEIRIKDMYDYAMKMEEMLMTPGIKVAYENGLLKISHEKGKDVAKLIRFYIKDEQINKSQLKYENGVLYIGKMNPLPTVYMQGYEKNKQSERQVVSELIFGTTNREEAKEMNWADLKSLKGNPISWSDENFVRQETVVSASKFEGSVEKNQNVQSLIEKHSAQIRHITWPVENSKIYGQFKSALSRSDIQGAKKSAINLMNRAGLKDISNSITQETDNGKLAMIFAQLADAMMRDSLSEQAFAGKKAGKEVILENKRFKAFENFTSSQGINVSSELRELAEKMPSKQVIPVHADKSIMALTFSSRLNEKGQVMYRGFDLMPPSVASLAGGVDVSIKDIATKRYVVEKIAGTVYFNNIVESIEKLTATKFNQQDIFSLKEHLVDPINNKLVVGGKTINLDVSHILFAYGKCLNPSLGLVIKGIKGMGGVSFNEQGFLVKSRYVREPLPDINSEGPTGGGNGGDGCAGSAGASGASGAGDGGGGGK